MRSALRSTHSTVGWWSVAGRSVRYFVFFSEFFLYFLPWNGHLCQQEFVPRWERRCSTCASWWAPPSTCTWPRWSTTRKVLLKCCTLPRGCSNTSPSSSTTSTSPRSTTARTCCTWPPWLRWSCATTGLKSVAIVKHGQDPSIVKWLLDIGADFHRRCYGTYDCDHQLVVIHRLLPFILSKPLIITPHFHKWGQFLSPKLKS